MTQAQKAMPYEPISFKRMHLNPESCRVRARQDRSNNLMIEVLCCGAPAMVFVYRRQKDWMIQRHIQQFSKLLGGVDITLPVQTQPLPMVFCWKIDSELSETQFWADPNLLVNVPPEKDGAATIEIRAKNGVTVATFTINGCLADDDVVLQAATRLQSKLQTRSKARVESLWENEKVVWYV